MTKTQAWVKAFRLRTLPLSFSNIILGTALAAQTQSIQYTVFGLTLLTTLLLQILSNLANDYGDAEKGTDNDQRVGPQRAIQSGAITQNEMKKAMVLFSFLAFLSGIALLFVAFDGQINWYFLTFILLGVASIGAAIKYTVGKGAYGYAGLGDVFVFIFFGLVGVMGTYYLQTQALDWKMLLPASTMGFFSSAVLNLNNMRDIVNDKEMGKHTLVVKLGAQKARMYHFLLFVLADVFYATYVFLVGENDSHLWMWLPLIVMVVIHVVHLKKVFSVTDPKNYDPELKKVALSALLFAVLVWIAVVL